ncbi:MULTISPECIES: hypothetical protein [unclassified Bradyrhizobium]|uniref:hypothetical protein n=1 Tax=unclassified Bradyrhizobium TaxID=2631580 RepID=UPI002479EA29|nr:MULTISPECIES: hypothetical protein [unclassified Bradyrhizobium]WGR74570.1 hypothetical protein MTX24_17820 [Bradyrhizobium sp. ISRA426]WGR79405.1 hypothetical protein MTX21_02935 [Bradyrhizobium sp. ISRA430]WGR89742.1 hypothetical protein MTX25_17500 [Bradyrhizobium sp. ISRA432]
MLCVLQIEGTSLENGMSRHLAKPFYRKEMLDDGREQLFYDVADASSRAELLSQVKQFLVENREGFAYALQRREEVEAMNLDIGIVMDGPLSKSVAFDNELIAMLAEFSLSVSISAYQAGSPA